MMRVLPAAALLISLFPTTASSQEQKPPDYVVAGWKRIVHSEADFSLNGTEHPDSERVVEYWSQIKLACVAEFDKMAESARSKGEIDRFTLCYVNLFGKEGAEADIRWALASSGVLFLNRGGALHGYADLAEPFSTHIVEACLASPAYYRRLYWFRRWAGDPVNTKGGVPAVGTHLSVVRDCIAESPDSGSYQFAVTNFLMDAYLCGWEDNFSDFKPPGNAAYFRSKFSQFFSYFIANASSLKFHRKQYRFRETSITVIPRWLKKSQLPPFQSPPIPFPDAKDLPPIQQPDSASNASWDWFRF